MLRPSISEPQVQALTLVTTVYVYLGHLSSLLLSFSLHVADCKTNKSLIPIVTYSKLLYLELNFYWHNTHTITCTCTNMHTHARVHIHPIKQ